MRVPRRAAVLPLAAGVLLLGACSSSTPIPAATGATFSGANAQFCDGFARLQQGEQTSQASPGGAAMAEMNAGAQQMVANLPADTPAAVKQQAQQLASDLAKVVANPASAAQYEQSLDTAGAAVSQFATQKCQ